MHPAEPADEMLQCYDDNGQPTIGRTRAEVKKKPYRWWYAVVRVWIVNDQGQIMCSKRSPSLSVSANPGKWQTYFGGHVGAGMTIKQTAVRELAEEAGLIMAEKNFYLVTQGRNEENKAFFESYAVRWNGEPHELKFTDDEVTEAKWISFDDYEIEKASHPDAWCNSCSLETQSIIKEWLIHKATG